MSGAIKEAIRSKLQHWLCELFNHDYEVLYPGSEEAMTDTVYICRRCGDKEDFME